MIALHQVDGRRVCSGLVLMQRHGRSVTVPDIQEVRK
jgi:hypothetical protein